ncbi:hypothetical protein HDU77_007072 [Chytriomyces hyalinus]|nr:hypothetical protein HDU77_007072 [Chytriomyces hyalinus]
MAVRMGMGKGQEEEPGKDTGPSQIDDVEHQERDAIENLITSIKPLLPKISNHIRTASAKVEESAVVPIVVQPQVQHSPDSPRPTKKATPPNSLTHALLDAPSKDSPRRKSLRDFFAKSGSQTNIEHSTVEAVATVEPAKYKSPESAMHSDASPVRESAVMRDSLASAPLSDDTLALALASLCNALYRLLENPEALPHPHPTLVSEPPASVNQNIQSLNEHTRGLMAIRSLANHESASPEQRAIWTEIDKLMALVQTLCITRSHLREQPPPYAPSTRVPTMLSMDELNSVISAIDRVVKVAPKLVNQCVTLSERQERKMDEAALTRLIERLFTGREEFQAQRASADNFARMSRLVDQIVQASKRSMDNQRVMPSESYRQKVEGAKLVNAIDKQEKMRFKNQDWISKETQLINELAQLQANLMNASKSMTNQRVELSETKELEIFLGSVLGRMNKSSQGFDGQNAVSITKKKKEDDLDQV